MQVTGPSVFPSSCSFCWDKQAYVYFMFFFSYTMKILLCTLLFILKYRPFYFESFDICTVVRDNGEIHIHVPFKQLPWWEHLETRAQSHHQDSEAGAVKTQGTSGSVSPPGPWLMLFSVSPTSSPLLTLVHPSSPPPGSVSWVSGLFLLSLSL